MFLQNELNGSSVVFFQNTWWHIGQCAGLYAGSSGSVDGVIFFCFGANQFTVKVSGVQKSCCTRQYFLQLVSQFCQDTRCTKIFPSETPPEMATYWLHAPETDDKRRPGSNDTYQKKKSERGASVVDNHQGYLVFPQMCFLIS